MLALWLLACSGDPSPAPPAPPLPGPLAAGLLPGAVLSLDGAWTHERSTRVLPAAAELKPFSVRRTLVLPDDWDPATPATLVADAAGWRVSASVDGVQVDSQRGGLWPVRLDLGGALKPGSQQLSLRFEGAGPTDAAAGPSPTNVKSWTYDHPRAGWTAARGSLSLEIGGGPRIVDLSVTAAGDTLRVAIASADAAGRAVSLAVVRDGRVLAELPDATLDDDGLAVVEAPWAGPRWTLGGDTAPQLQTLVARVAGGGATALRFGVRQVDQDGRQLTVDGEPVYLVAQRHVPGGDDPRQELAALAWWLVETGANAIELHGVLHSDAVLQATDELGIPVAFTPRCTGGARNDRPGALNPALGDFLVQGNAALADSREDHPSILAWTQEEDVLPDWPQLYAPFGGAGAVLIDRDARGLDEPRLAEAIREQRMGTWITELPWSPSTWNGRSLAERMRPLLDHHRPWGAGLVLPHFYWDPGAPGPPPLDVAPIQAELKALLADAGVAPLVLGERRGPAGLTVQVQRLGQPAAGELVLLHLAEQPPLATFSDVRGTARFTVDYAGSAAVSSLDGQARVDTSLVNGRYREGRWEPSVAQVTLSLDP